MQRTVESVSRLHSLTLHDNPWTCDCHLRPLLHWLQVVNSFVIVIIHVKYLFVYVIFIDDILRLPIYPWWTFQGARNQNAWVGKGGWVFHIGKRKQKTSIITCYKEGLAGQWPFINCFDFVKPSISRLHPPQGISPLPDELHIHFCSGLPTSL